jgi:tetratricopeptide (TPR) repeat protein
MKDLDLVKLGMHIRTERKKKGLRQHDLVDHVLTQSTISNIEKGKGGVGEKKIRYLMRKLGIDDDLEPFRRVFPKDDDDQFEEEVKLKLISIENILHLINVDQGFEQLQKLLIPDKHPLLITVEYLKGKGYAFKQNWGRAIQHFTQTIHLCKQLQSYHTNMESISYYELSRIEFYQNHFPQAIRLGEDALRLFDLNGERTYYYDLMLISQAIYLEKVNRIGDAQNVLEKLSQRRRIHEKIIYSETNEASLNGYEIQAKLLGKGKQFSQAVEVAQKGIELARVDRSYDRLFELWTTLGSIYTDWDKPHLAKICFQTALMLQRWIEKDSLLTYTHTQLGFLHLKQENVALAIGEFQKAHQLSKKSNDEYREIEALEGLGTCYLKQGELEKATVLLKKALQLAKKHRFDDKLNTLTLLVGHCFVKRDDPQIQSLALEYFYESIKSLEGGENMLKIKRHAAGDPPAG